MSADTLQLNNADNHRLLELARLPFGNLASSVF